MAASSDTTPSAGATSPGPIDAGGSTPPPGPAGVAPAPAGGRPAQTTAILDRSGNELKMLRDVVIRAHGLASGMWVQSAEERLRRVELLTEAAIDASPVMAGVLGRGGPEAQRDILGGSGTLG